MSYQFAGLDAALAAAVGEDDALMRDLRRALEDSALVQLDLLRRARCDANWHLAAERLHGLAVSFGADDLAAAARDAIQGVPGDPAVLRKVAAAVARLGD